MNRTRKKLSLIGQRFQTHLFPFLEEVVAHLTKKHRQFVTVLDIAQINKVLAGASSRLFWRSSAVGSACLGAGIFSEGDIWLPDRTSSEFNQ